MGLHKSVQIRSSLIPGGLYFYCFGCIELRFFTKIKKQYMGILDLLWYSYQNSQKEKAKKNAPVVRTDDDDRCKCIVCERRFDYGDEWSPVLKDSIWARIIQYYDLVDIEKANEVLFNYYYNLWQENKGTTKGKEYHRECGNHQTFICYPCMEKALGRKLTREDLIGKDVPLNVEFERVYFND